MMPPKKQHAAMWLAKLLATAPNGKRKAWHLARLLTANLNKKGKRALKSKYNALFRKGSFVLHAPKQFRHDVVFLLHNHGVQTKTIVRNMALDLEITGVRKTHALRKATAEVSGVLFPKQTVAVVSSAALVGGVGAAPDPGAGSVSSPELGGGVEAAPLEPVQAAEVVCTYPNTRCHDTRNNLIKFTDDKIKLMLVPNWASVAPGGDLLDVRFVNMEVYATESVGASINKAYPAFLCAVRTYFSDSGCPCFSLDVRWADDTPLYVDQKQRYKRQERLRVDAASGGGSKAYRNAKQAHAEQWACGKGLTGRMIWHARAFRP